MKTEKLNSRPVARALILGIATVFLSFSCSSKEDPSAMEKAETSVRTEPLPYTIMENGDTTWVEVDKMPEYEGGVGAILKYIMENVKYPDVSIENGIQGRVIVRFRIANNGSVDNVSVLRSLSPEIDAESVKVIQSLPKFNSPAMKDGKPVAVWYMVPVNFQLSNQ